MAKFDKKDMKEALFLGVGVAVLGTALSSVVPSIMNLYGSVSVGLMLSYGVAAFATKWGIEKLGW